MMFYRRKLILGLIQAFGGELNKINLQKLMFLVCNKQEKPVYEFIPYKYGCYSHSLKADLQAMVRQSFLGETTASYEKKDKEHYLGLLTHTDKLLVNQTLVQFKNIGADELMKYTYTRFPYYAIHSERAEMLLDAAQLKKIRSSKPVQDKTALFTIGYESKSLEAYLNKLVINDIKVLVDVRNNPLSQKFGFSKNTLKACCNGLEIEYIHLPEVGIESSYRKELKSQQDYEKLFLSYKKKTLPKTLATQQKILDLLVRKKRIALTCFESDICQCHRKHLAEAITRLPGWNFELIHI